MVARGGIGIRYALFPATGRPLKGTVVVLTGRNEFIEKYFETINSLNANGFAVAAMDWRGQGGSDRMLKDRQRGYVKRFDQYVDDLDQFMTEIVLPDCRGPFYVLAHSMGGLISLLAAPRLFNRVRRMVLCAPFIELVGQTFSTDTLRRMTGIASWLGLGKRYISGGDRPPGGPPFAGNKLTSDLVRYTRNQAIIDAAPDLALGGPTISWMHAACVACDKVLDQDFLGRIHIPTLIIAAGADEVVSTPALENLSRRMRAASLVTVDGAQHEILQEADVFREQFLSAFYAFVPGEGAEMFA
jgi:lysophospholipase